MGEFLQGRVNAVHDLGALIETASVTCEKEIVTFEAMKDAFAMCIKTFGDHKDKLVDVQRCIDLVKHLHNETETKRHRSQGAHDCLTKIVEDIKKLYDVETKKLHDEEEYEKNGRDIKQRPIGVSPGNPLDDYKKKSKVKRVKNT